MLPELSEVHSLKPNVLAQVHFVKKTEKLLDNSYKQLYDRETARLGCELTEQYEVEDEDEKFARIIKDINTGIGAMGVCAKYLKEGDVAWRCLDCEMDPTSIICKECYEKSDHKGHRVQLKRNISGCCDCGDPEDWDPEHFCTDHRGFTLTPEEILDKIPKDVRHSANLVFTEISIELKKSCLALLNYQFDQTAIDQFQSKELYKQTMIKILHRYFQFLRKRVEEVPAFLFIIQQKLCMIQFDEELCLKNHGHQRCCVRAFICKEEEKAYEATLEGLKQVNVEDLCTCSAYDLCLQINSMLDNQTRELFYEFHFKMFESFEFKQRLTLALTANYNSVMATKAKDSKYHICNINVQVMTSQEMTILLFENKPLLDNMLWTLDHHIEQFGNNPQDSEVYYAIFCVLYDFRYIARPETIQMCIQQTDLVEKLIEYTAKLYFVDSKVPRNTMIAYMQDGSPNEKLLNLELFFLKVLKIYLSEVKFDDVAKNQKVMTAFINQFQAIHKEYKTSRKGHGIYCLPLHRAFGFYLSRLLMFNHASQPFKAMRDSFQETLEAALSKSELNIGNNFMEFFDKCIKADEGLEIKSLMEVNQKNQPSNEDILVPILDLQIWQMSFVHEICAKKWVLLGEYLEYYPTIYFRLMDKFTHHDFACFQMLLALSHPSKQKTPLFERLVSNFGLDGQLKALVQGLKQNDLKEETFAKFARFDSNKLRLQLIFYLRLIAQLCLTEQSYLNQIYREGKNNLQGAGKDKIFEMWKRAMKKEAVHQLVLNKVNSSIQTVKQGMKSSLGHLVEDKTFEAMLMEVSQQSRDISNQMTFRLKDQYYGHFDPFHYLSFDHNSAVYQMYDHHNMDQFESKGVNNIVGDYLNYSQEGINQLLVRNLAQSSILQVIVPLLETYLQSQLCSHPAQSQQTSATQIQEEEQKSEAMQLISKLYSLIGKDQETKPASRKNSILDPVFLDKLVDANVGQHCLKILIVILKHPIFTSKRHSLTREELDVCQKVIGELSANNCQMVKQMCELVASKDCEPKLQKIFTFLRDKIYQLSPDNFKFIEEQIDINQLSQKEQIGPEKSQDTKKLKQHQVKKRQSKLMAKMKQTGNKFLTQKLATHQVEEEKEESKEDVHQCSLCQELLTQETFAQNPFGNFVYVQSTKLYYYSMKQTIRGQQQAFQNQQNAFQAQEEEKQSSSFGFKATIFEEEKKSSLISEELGNKRMQSLYFADKYLEKSEPQISSESINQLPLVPITSGFQQCNFQNQVTGSGGVLTNCKHYCHFNCLWKYTVEQELHDQGQYQIQLSGFQFGEFACPICKCICNSVVPSYSFSEILNPESPLFISSLTEKDESGMVDIPEEKTQLIDIYTSLINQLMKSQLGLVHHQLPTILLRDIKEDPILVVETIIKFMLHNIHLIDIKGTAFFQAQANQLACIFSSIKSIVNLVAISKHPTYAHLNEHSETMAEQLNNYFNYNFIKTEQNVLAQNVVAILLRVLMTISIKEGVDHLEAISFILKHLMPVIEHQFLIAVFFRKQNGRVSSLEALPQDYESFMRFQEEVSKDAYLQNLMAEVKLPVLRKLCAGISLIMNCYQAQSSTILSEISGLSSDVDEIEVMTAYLTSFIRPKEEVDTEVANIVSQFTKHQDNHAVFLDFLREQVRPQMPVNLLLMTPNFEFNLEALPDNFLRLQTEFYQKLCCYCKKERQDTVTCLLCGETMCWFKIQGGQCAPKCNMVKLPTHAEKLMSYHARVHEGGQALFLQTSTGQIILISNGTSGIFESVYRNKYGESVTNESKYWESFKIDEEGGGQADLAKIRKQYLDFKIANAILLQRINPDTKFKVYNKHSL